MDTVTKNSLIKRKTNVISQLIDGKFIVLDTRSNMLFYLNESAQFIFHVLAKPKTIHELIDVIVEEYQVSKQKASTDVRHFLKAVETLVEVS